MAILNSIRKRGVFLIVIIAMALFSFILADVIRNGGFSSEKSLTTVGTVNGEKIPQEDFMRKVENQQRNMGINGSMAQSMNAVWERELRDVLQRQEFEKLGLVAQRERIEDGLRAGLASNPTFQDENGVYSPGKVQEYIADVKRNNPTGYSQWLDYENTIRTSSLQTAYYNMIKAGMRSTLTEGETQYRFENDKVNMEFVFVPYTKIPDTEVEVSDSEIATYVKQHPKDFQVDAQVDIQYVAFSEKPTAEDMKAAEASINELLNDKEEYNSNIKATETVKGLRNTTNYEEFVNANSDVAFNDNFVFKSQLPADIAENIFALNVGEIYGPYKVGQTNNLSKVIEEKTMPDSVQSRHILIRYEGSMRASDAITRSKEAAQQLADSLNTVLNQSPSKFEEIAKTFSEDTSNSDNGGDLGYSGPGRMVPAFNDFIFDNKTGTIGVVETDFGFHVVEVQEQKNEQRAVKLATITKEIEASEQTLNDVFANASKFEVATQNKDFADVAAEMDVTVLPVNRISAMDANIPGIGENRTLVNWAFNEETEIGDVKRFSTPDGYVIAQLTRKDEKGLLSVSEASAKVLPILRNKKKAEKIKSSITGSTLQEVATNQGVSVQSALAVTRSAPTLAGAGAEPLVVGQAFAMEQGETSGLITGEKGVFMIKVDGFVPAPELQNYTAFADQLTNKATPSVNTKVYQALKSAAEIDDNRANFF